MRYRIAMTLLAVVFAIYGVKEMFEALEDGRSTRASLEAFGMSGLFLALGGWLGQFDTRPWKL